MTRHTLLLLGLLGAVPAVASAQSQAFSSGVVVTRNGETVTSAAKVYGTVADCEQNATFTFSVNKYNMPVPVVEAWLGVGTTSCVLPANRQKAPISNAAPVCKLLGRDDNNRQIPLITVAARELFSQSVTSATATTTDSDGGVAEVAASGNGCDGVKGSPVYVVYLLPLEQATNVDTNLAPTVSTTYSPGALTATFTPFTKRPDSPTNPRAESGESSIGLQFDIKTGDQAAQTTYRAYFDYGSGGSIGCGSGALEATTAADGTSTPATPPAPGTPDIAESKKTTTDSASLSGLDALGIAIGDSVAVAAVTIDPAGNESLLSEVKCVPRVNTAGFWDACRADSKCKDGLDTCSLSVVPTRSALSLSALIALGALFAARRRRKI